MGFTVPSSGSGQRELLLFVGFRLLISPRTDRPVAALPAGIATLATSLLAHTLGTRAPRKPHPPGEGLESHI